MPKKHLKHYLFASDFDQTLTFNDTGYVLSELVGISLEEFERKIKGMAKLNLVQQGAELAYLLLHDPEFRGKVRKDHLYEAGKRIRLKENIKQVYDILDRRIDGFHFDFYVLSAAPVEVIKSALEGIVPEDHIFGTEFKYSASGEIESLVRATAGYGKVARLDQLQEDLGIPADHVVYVGDGGSDIHVMLHVNRRDGFTIAVSEAKHIAQIAKRTVLSDDPVSVIVPILEDIVGWDPARIRALLESRGDGHPVPGAVRDAEVAVLAARHLDEEVRRRPVDELHQEAVGERAGDVERQLVHDVGRDGHLVGAREAPDPERLAEAVGAADVGHEIAGRPALDQLPELEPRVVVLAGRHRNPDVTRDLGARGDVVGEDRLLVPDEVQVFQEPRLADRAQDVELLVRVDHEADALAERLAHGHDPLPVH